jgi:hypothetical protein
LYQKIGQLNLNNSAPINLTTAIEALKYKEALAGTKRIILESLKTKWDIKKINR